MKKRPWILACALAVLVLACSCMPTSLLAPGEETPQGEGSDQQSDGGGGLPDDLYGDDGDDTSNNSAANYEQASQLAGHWTGTWTNTTFGSTGSLDVLIDIETDGDAVLTLTIGGNALGVGNVPTLTIPGYYDDFGWVFESIQVPVFGNISVFISYARSFTMTTTTPPDTGILYVNANGMALDDGISINYDVSFSAGSLAQGTATLTRAP